MSFSDFRVYLRALEIEDHEISVSWRNDEELWHSLAGRRYFVSRQTERTWIADAGTDSANVKLAICLKDTGEYIGNVYLTNIDLFNRNAASGIFIGQSQHRGHGYGVEAYTLLLWHGFFDLGLVRVSARVLTDNKASIRQHEKCGYKHEGVLRRAVYKNGDFRDLSVMSILRDEYFEHIQKTYGVTS